MISILFRSSKFFQAPEELRSPATAITGPNDAPGICFFPTASRVVAAFAATTSLHVTRCFVQRSSFIHHHLALIDDSTMTTLHVTGKLWVCSFGCKPTHPLVCNCETGWVFFILIVRSTNDDDDDEPCRLIEY